MGMSASQARLIALTARMNDIEYQGQQINQQRTTLSSQINELYNSLLSMDVPTPPSTTDFTKVVYTGVMLFRQEKTKPVKIHIQLIWHTKCQDIQFQEILQQLMSQTQANIYITIQQTEAATKLQELMMYTNLQAL